MQWKRFTTENDVGKREKLEKYKENSGRVQRKNKYRSKEARKVKLSKEKKFQEERIIKKVYSENVISME